MSTTSFLINPATTAQSLPPDITPAVAAPMIAFLEFVSPDLEAVEERMDSDLGDDLRTVYDVTRHLLLAGGKRLRPAMVALAARAVLPDTPRERIALVGAGVEFVHMATLVHDDVVDNTATRRGKPTANSVFGNGVAVLSGDYILARAMRLLTLDGDIRIIRTVSDITIEMSEGQVMEIRATGNPNLPRHDYLEILRKKTAVFVEGCCRVGAMVAGGTDEVQEALARYGYAIGMAFQLADDLLDYTGDPAITGKPRGSDLKDGRATLPLSLGLEAGSGKERAQLLAAFGVPDLADSEVLAICEILERYDCFERTRAVACSYLNESDTALSILPPTPAKNCFEQLTEFVVQRDR